MHLSTSRYFPIADDLRKQVEAWEGVENVPDPVTPRLAATVILLRDTPAGIEVFMLRRASGMSFAPDRFAFPGGRVDGTDSDEVPWGGWTPARCQQRLGLTDPGSARELVVAAVRETFEECGVLLAAGQDGDLVGDLSAGSWKECKQKIVTRELSFADFLRHSELTLRADLLHPWARWVTPEGQLRRYDTVFFVAALPPGQEALIDTTEAVWGGWMLAADAAKRGHSGGTNDMLPPTLVALEELAAISTVAAAMSRVRNLDPVLPRIERRDGDWVTAVDLPAGPSMSRGRDVTGVVTGLVNR